MSNELRARGVDFGPYRQYTRADDTIPIDFGVVKVSEGAWEQPEWRYHVDREEIQKIPVLILYHWIVSYTNWQEQVEFFLDGVDYLGRDKFVAVWCDFERRNNLFTPGFATSTYHWMQAVRNELDKEMVLYTSPYMYKEGLIDQGADWMEEFDLAIAQYPYYEWNDALLGVPDPAVGWQPNMNYNISLMNGREDWRFWQYSGRNSRAALHGITAVESGNYIAAVDHDVANMTPDELHVWAGLEPPVKPPPTTDYSPLIAEVETVLNKYKGGV